MTAPYRFRAQLKEPAIDEDKFTGQAGQLPTFNAFSASGDVTAQLVYVNYGIPEDYEYLKKIGIDVKGRIAIVRYGRGWRGVKAKLAQEYGAVGLPDLFRSARGRIFPERRLSEGPDAAAAGRAARQRRGHGDLSG